MIVLTLPMSLDSIAMTLPLQVRVGGWRSLASCCIHGVESERALTASTF
jgi:hypothetical protein